MATTTRDHPTAAPTSDTTHDMGRGMARAAATLAAPVRVSLTLACGCTHRPSAPLPAKDAASLPGRVLICDTHDEWTVSTRVTTHLVTDPATLHRLFTAEGLDTDTVNYLVALYATT